MGLVILGISKSLIYEFSYDYLKPKYDNNIGLCYMDTGSFTFHVETEDFYKMLKKKRKLKEQRSVLLKKILSLMIIGLVCLIIIQF